MGKGEDSCAIFAFSKSVLGLPCSPAGLMREIKTQVKGKRERERERRGSQEKGESMDE